MSAVLVVGAGIFGVTAALELRSRGRDVKLMDPGPIPHPLAASTDISKVVRMEYGPDESYMSLMEEAREGWLRWNAEWSAAGGDPLYHETGVLMISREAMSPGGFEHESYELLRKRGHAPERMDRKTIAKRFPAWRPGAYTDGFFHASGGYAESGRVVAALAERARTAGVEMLEGSRMEALLERGARVTGVRDETGAEIRADEVVLATGAWAGKDVPEIAESIRATGHPVFHLKPKSPDLFAPERFPTFTADIAKTGFYGFPLSRDGVVKIANHGAGVAVDPDGPREVSPRERRRFASFLEETFPDLAGAEIVFTRLCLYADTQDEDFWIARDPKRRGLAVAGGGSGHGFKFAPILGPIIADAVDGKDTALLRKFRWRPELRLQKGQEAARCHDPPASLGGDDRGP